MSTSLTPLVEKATCPHCWHVFPPEDVLWISAHAELLGDVRLGPDHQQRFLPSRFTPDGNVIDPCGQVCHGPACPRCHLPVPRALLESEPLFLSIIGAPACGKSFFLTAMTWELRRLLPDKLRLSFADVDAEINQALTGNEEALFLNPAGKQTVSLDTLIRKTQLEGELYNVVRDGDQEIRYLRPFLFALQPQNDSPDEAKKRDRIVCLYDNAGEHFLAGQDSARVPVTQHLARSQLLFFLFDPTQDARFARYLAAPSQRPTPHSGKLTRQEMILVEAGNRIRRYTNLPQRSRHKCPLVVIVTKSDVWDFLLQGDNNRAEPWYTSQNEGYFFSAFVENRSKNLRQLLKKLCPEVVTAAESFAEWVVYVPVSALGQSPQITSAGKAVLRPEKIKPTWVTVPFLYGLKLITDLVPG